MTIMDRVTALQTACSGNSIRCAAIGGVVFIEPVDGNDFPGVFRLAVAIARGTGYIFVVENGQARPLSPVLSEGRETRDDKPSSRLPRLRGGGRPVPFPELWRVDSVVTGVEQ